MGAVIRRWVCPLCGSGRKAPSRPRTNDSRRYCFPCSEETGRLVQRECPVEDKERQRREERRTDREKRAAERVRSKALAWPYRLEVDARRYLKLAAWDAPMAGTVVKVHRRNRSSSSGHAGMWQADVFAGTDVGDAHYVLLHELAHVANLRRPSGGYDGPHGSRFWGILHTAVEEVVGRPVEMVTSRVGRRSVRRHIYAKALLDAVAAKGGI